MSLDEVSKIEIKTFPIDNIKDFTALNLDEKLIELECLIRKGKIEYEFTDDKIGLGDAFQRAMNALFEGEAEAALIVEWRVLTLPK